jgi:hypothetical protein
MHGTYSAVIKEDGDWWFGWIAEIPGVNCQERTRDELLESLRITRGGRIRRLGDEARSLGIARSTTISLARSAAISTFPGSSGLARSVGAGARWPRVAPSSPSHVTRPVRSDASASRPVDNELLAKREAYPSA